jgi:hypothetical protein
MNKCGKEKNKDNIAEFPYCTMCHRIILNGLGGSKIIKKGNPWQLNENK